MNPVVDSSDKCLLLEQFLFQVAPVLPGRRVRESADFLLKTLHELGVLFGSEKHFMVQSRQIDDRRLAGLSTARQRSRTFCRCVSTVMPGKCPRLISGMIRSFSRVYTSRPGRSIRSRNLSTFPFERDLSYISRHFSIIRLASFSDMRSVFMGRLRPHQARGCMLIHRPSCCWLRI